MPRQYVSAQFCYASKNIKVHMGFDYFNLVLSAIVFFIYSAICIISIIFTFSLDIYSRIDEKLNAYIIPPSAITIFDTNINGIETWMMNHNKIVGPILILLSLVDIRLSFDILNKL